MKKGILTGIVFGLVIQYHLFHLITFLFVKIMAYLLIK